MLFVINGMKYDTEKMERVAVVKKWYQDESLLMKAIYPGRKVGQIYDCELWKTKKGNWLLTHEKDCRVVGYAIGEEEARVLLMRYAAGVYESMFDELPEA